MAKVKIFPENELDHPVKVVTSSSRSVDALHMHGYIQIFCVKTGNCVHDLAGDSQKLNPGEISIAPPLKPHCIDGRDNEYEMFGMDAHRNFFKLSNEFMPWNIFDSCISPLCETVLKKGHVFKPETDVNNEIFNLYFDLKKLSNESSVDNHLLLRGKAIELLSLVAIGYSSSEGKLMGNGASDNCAPIHEAFSFIHKNYNNDISLDKIRKAAMLSERTLFRLFEDSMNVPVHRYIQALRLNHAKKLLTETDRTIRDIANDSGFSYLSNFHRFFRACTGMSPCDFRDISRAEKESVGVF